jgi:hypothetical protein
VRPNRSAHPLPLLDDIRVCFLDELAHSAEGFPAPVSEFGDSVLMQPKLIRYLPQGKDGRLRR